MYFKNVLHLVIAFAILRNGCCQMGKTTIKEDKSGSSGSISFGTPDLSDEESNADYMPRGLRCDGCKAVAWGISKVLQV